MKTSTTFLVLLFCSVAACGAASAETVTTWHWAPSPLLDERGAPLPAADRYEVFLAVDGKPDEFVAAVYDTLWQLDCKPGCTYRLCVRAVSREGLKSAMSEPSEVWTAPVVSSVPDETGSYLGAAVPNPFNPVTSISYVVPENVRGSVSLRVLDLRGSVVRDLEVDPAPGEHRARWNGTDRQGRHVAAGVYMVQYRCGTITSLTKVTMLQ